MKENKIIKYTILTGLWSILIIPFFVANTMFFPFITGKNFAFRIIVEIIFTLWVYLAYVNPKYRPKFSWILVSVAAFVGIMLIADIHAVNPMKALWSNFERMDGWVTQIHLLMYLLVFASVMNTEKLWLWFFRSSVFAALIMSFYVINQWLTTGAARVDVNLGNAIYVAVYFLFNFFLALLLLYKDVIVKSMGETKRGIKIFKNWLFYAYIILSVLFFFDIWRTGTRGVILGLLGGLVITCIAVAIFEKRDGFMKKSSVAVLVFIALIIGGFFAIKNTSLVQKSDTLQRLAEISWNDVAGQGQARQYVWPMAIKGAEEKPILGWGQEGFNYVFNKYYDPRMYDQEQWFDRAHDTPLDILVAGGILGLLAYLLIFLAAVLILWKKRGKFGVIDAAIILGLLAAYFAQNLFVFDNLTSYFYFFMILAYIYAKDAESREAGMPAQSGKPKENPKITNSEVANYIIAPILLVILFTALYFVNIKPIEANTTLIQALQSYPEGPSKNLDYFNQALSYNTFGNAEIREQILNIAPQVVQSQADTQVKQDFANLAYDEIQNQISQTPLDARYQFFAGVFLDNINQFSQATPFLEKAVEYSPTKQTMLLELAKNYAYAGQNDKALATAKQAYDEENSFDDAKQYYAAMMILNGQINAAKELMAGEGMSNDIFVRVYLIMAEADIQKGDKSSAIAEINSAIQANSGFKDQGQQIITGILNGTLK